MNRRRVKILCFSSAAITAIAAVVAFGIAAWIQWTDWFVIGPLWRQALELAEMRKSSPQDAAFQPTELRGLSPFDVTLSKLYSRA